MSTFEDRRKTNALDCAMGAAEGIDQMPIEEFGDPNQQAMQEKAFARMIASDTTYQFRVGSKIEHSFDATKATSLYPRAVSVLESLGYIGVETAE